MDKKLVNDLNFRVLSKHCRNLEKILHCLPFAVLALYDPTTQMWTYLKFRGPLFLIQDKLKNRSLVILNQYSVRDFVQPILNSHKFELKQLSTGGYMMNFGVEDTIAGWTVKGIWTQDEGIRELHAVLVGDQ